MSSGYRRSKKGVERGECLRGINDENVDSLESIENSSLAETTQGSIPAVNMADLVSDGVLLSRKASSGSS